MSTQKCEGLLGDTIPSNDAPDTQTSGAQKPEAVEDRPNVSQVKPEDYSEADRTKIAS